MQEPKQERLFQSGFFNNMLENEIKTGQQEAVHGALEQAVQIWSQQAMAQPLETNQEHLSGAKPEQTFDKMWDERGLPARSIEDLLRANPVQQEQPQERNPPERWNYGKPVRVAMADDPSSKGKPMFEVGGGRGGGYSGGRSVYQAQLSSEGLSPAVKVGDKIFEGSNHPDAIKQAEKSLGSDFYDLTGGVDAMRASQGFTSGKGKFLTREQAGKLYGVTKTGE